MEFGSQGMAKDSSLLCCPLMELSLKQPYFNILLVPILVNRTYIIENQF